MDASTSTVPPLWLLILINYGAMLLLSLLIMFLVGRGRLGRWGFRRAGRLRWVLLLPVGLGLGIGLTLVNTLLPGGEAGALDELTLLQQILLIWFLASVAEEVLMRGLIQGALDRWRGIGLTVAGARFSLPVLTAAALFGAMHVALTALGAGAGQVIATVIFAFALGVIAGVQRESSGSLLPAVILHLLANAGGTLAGVMLSLW